MDIKDWVGLLALVISAGALGLSTYSIILTRRRDRREIDAARPTCEIGFDRLTKGYANDATLYVLNNGKTTLTLRRLEVVVPDNWTFTGFANSDADNSVALDLSTTMAEVDLGKYRLAPEKSMRREFGVRLKSYDDPMSEGPPDITFALTVSMGGEFDQEERFIIRRTLKD